MGGPGPLMYKRGTYAGASAAEYGAARPLIGAGALELRIPPGGQPLVGGVLEAVARKERIEVVLKIAAVGAAAVGALGLLVYAMRR